MRGSPRAGGVKDVVRGLAEAHARRGAEMSVVLPLYGFLPPELYRGETVASFTLSFPDQDKANAFQIETVQVVAVHREGVRLLLVDSPRFAEKRLSTSILPRMSGRTTGAREARATGIFTR